MGVGDKRDLILAGVTVAIVVVTLGLGFGLKKGTSLPGTNCWKAQSIFFLVSNSWFHNGYKAYSSLLTYSDLLNNCAANIIIFGGDFHLNTLFKTYTFINFCLQNLIFTFINEKKSFLHTLIKAYIFYQFLRNLQPTQWYGLTQLFGR